jgi:4-amino-4-deoxy-L-arabinose transferase-like glycosyltransferase
MLSMLDLPPVQRTQEARVLETAREMLGAGWRNWLIPHLNGQIRLEKPPLAYWLAAIAFKIGGVSEGVGRVPFALVGFATLIVTWTIARRLFDRRAAFYTAATLIGGWMFARHARLAETDILATCFVTAAVGCILLGRLGLSGVMIGLAVLAKGLPAVFAVMFLLALAAVERDWRLLWRWVKSGAPIFAILIGLPWFLYVGSAVGLKTIQDEAEIGVRGMEHTGSVFQYIPQTLLAVAPWTALTVLAIVVAVGRWREDRRLRIILLWAAAVIVPLCFAGQKQYHYLFPAMPALAVLTGWLIDEVLNRNTPAWEWGRTLLIGTLIVMVIISAALPVVGWKLRGTVLPLDWFVLVLCGIGSGPAWMLWRRSPSQGTFCFAIAAAVCMTVLTQAWMPSLRRSNPRDVAITIRAVGPGPYYFYGENVSLPLLFYIGERMPRLTTPADLERGIVYQPDMIVVAQTKSGRSPPPVPQGLERAAEITSADQTFEVYRVRR